MIMPGFKESTKYGTIRMAFFNSMIIFYYKYYRKDGFYG